MKMFITEQLGSINNFDSIAEQLWTDVGYDSFQLAPGGIISQTYPDSRNEKQYIDLFSYELSAEDAKKAKDTKSIVISDPVPMPEDYVGLMVNNPVYFGDEFWGFTMMALRIPDILEAAKLDNLTSRNYFYVLSKSGTVVTANTERQLTKPVVATFDLYGETWELAVAPALGWISVYNILGEIMTAFIILCLLYFLFMYYVLLNEERHKYATLANHDILTGLYNRRQLENDMTIKFSTKEPFMLCYMDLDRFKSVNDTYGHSIGDALLVEIAERLTSACKENSALYRIGGDEFVAITEDDTQVEAFRSVLRKPFVINEKSINTSLSLGYAKYPDDGMTLDDLIRIADSNMYENKELSK